MNKALFFRGKPCQTPLHPGLGPDNLISFNSDQRFRAQIHRAAPWKNILPLRIRMMETLKFVT